MRESKLLKSVITGFSQFGARLFRNNVGLAWTGDVTRISPTEILIKNARPIKFGLCVGSSDCIGFTPLVISEKHLGKTIAVFSAIETKSKNGRTSREQVNFVNYVKSQGGYAAVVRSLQEAAEAVDRV